MVTEYDVDLIPLMVRDVFSRHTWARSGSGPRARICSPLPGGSGHHSRRHYDRCGRCCPWTGTGEGGQLPLEPGPRKHGLELSQLCLRAIGESRGGAPEGERSPPGPLPHPMVRTVDGMRLSALRLPSLRGGKGRSLACVRGQSSRCV